MKIFSQRRIKPNQTTKFLSSAPGYRQATACLIVICLGALGYWIIASHASTDCRTVSLEETAIRQALLQGGSICLPAGTVNITKPLRITASNTKLLGAGQDNTTLRMAFGPAAYGPLIAIPAEWSTDFGGGNPPPVSMRVSGVEIANLSIDGAREGNPNTYGSAQATTIRFGIQSTVSTGTYLHNLHIYDIAGDAIGFGNGNGVNIRPKVEDVLIERTGRNGIHLGNAEDAAIRRSKIRDTPGVYWKDAGAGIDIEVEGQDPHVFRTVIEDNEISRPSNPGFAGFGIQVTRAFGDVNDLLIQRLVQFGHLVVIQATAIYQLILTIPLPHLRPLHPATSTTMAMSMEPTPVPFCAFTGQPRRPVMPTAMGG